MKYKKLEIDGPVLFSPQTFSDDRGSFMETFKASIFNEAFGKIVDFVQDNQSLSIKKGTVRGLHFQSPPRAQGKLVRCVAGAILDVAVDVRKGSDTFGQHVKADLTSFNNQQLWVPEGFLHGFVTLEPNTVVAYKCTDYYSKEHDGNVRWDDPNLEIDWDISKSNAILSDKDINAPLFEDFDSPF